MGKIPEKAIRDFENKSKISESTKRAVRAAINRRFGRPGVKKRAGLTEEELARFSIEMVQAFSEVLLRTFPPAESNGE